MTEGEVGDVVEDAAAEVVPAHGVWTTFAPRVALWVAVVLVLGLLDLDPALALMLVAVAGVITIVTDARFGIERRVEALGLPSREAWVPLLMLVVLFGSGLVEPGRVGPVLEEQGPVILFILAFALVSEGLGRSGFFHFLAFRLAERGGADMVRLTLYLFLLSSILTYFTSNDIVILTMTPIVMSVVYQARIRNAKLLLLSQFVAANTVSMGLMVGSPTNLIMGRAIQMGFGEYLLLMAAPSIMALMVTFVFVTVINSFVNLHSPRRGTVRNPQVLSRMYQGSRLHSVVDRLVGTWQYSRVYSPPRFSEFRTFTGEMGQWIGLFSLAVVALAFGAGSSAGLLLAAAVIGGVGLIFLGIDNRRGEALPGRQFAGRTIRVLPVGIVFFGMTYFLIADAIAGQRFVQEDVESFVTTHGSSHSPLASWGSILSAGALVNTMNDLPASALSGEVIAGMRSDGNDPVVDDGPSDDGFETPFDRILVMQGLLVGLNIGTYVTPVGALAGIIWFDILRKERDRRSAMAVAANRVPLDVTIPGRRDLVVYGTVMFLVTALVVGATNFGFVSLADWLTGPHSLRTRFGEAPNHGIEAGACLVLALATAVVFYAVLRRHGVALTHLGDLLFLMTRVRLRAARHRWASAILVFTTIFIISAVLLYNVELFHDAHYSASGIWGGHQSAHFDGPVDFSLWLHAFITSGYEGENDFPDSVFGRLVAPILVLGAITTVLFLVRALLTGGSDQHVRERFATGEIPCDRLVVVNPALESLRIIETLACMSRRFVTVVTGNQLLGDRLQTGPTDNMAVIDHRTGPQDLVPDLRLHEAREIVLLSRSVADDFDNLDLLKTLDTVVVGDDEGAGPEATADGEGPPDPPVILLQCHGTEVMDLVERRISRTLRASMACFNREDVVRGLVTATVAGREEDLRGFYRRNERESVCGGDEDAARYVRLVGLDLTLADDDRGPSARPGEIDLTDDATASGRARSRGRSVTVRRAAPAPGGTAAAPQRTATATGTRTRVNVVGGDALAQSCALDLLADGVGAVTLFRSAHDALEPGLDDRDGLEIRECVTEMDVVQAILRRGVQAGDAVLVVESSGEWTFDTERLLQKLRTRSPELGRPDPVALPSFYVCCHGPDRFRRLHNCAESEVIDTTWVEASYISVFANLYFNVLVSSEATARWPQARRIAVADRIAQQLCHLVLVRPSAPRGGGPGSPDRSVIGLTGTEAVARDRAADPERWRLGAVIRFGVEPDTDPSHLDPEDEAAAPVVVVQVSAPLDDAPIGPDDLLVRLPLVWRPS